MFCLKPYHPSAGTDEVWLVAVDPKEAESLSLEFSAPAPRSSPLSFLFLIMQELFRRRDENPSRSRSLLKSRHQWSNGLVGQLHRCILKTTRIYVFEVHEQTDLDDFKTVR